MVNLKKKIFIILIAVLVVILISIVFLIGFKNLVKDKEEKPTDNIDSQEEINNVYSAKITAVNGENIEEVHNFIKRLNKSDKEKLTLQIVLYTVEGDPIYEELTYNPSPKYTQNINQNTINQEIEFGYYTLKIDNTKDRFAVNNGITTNNYSKLNYTLKIETIDGNVTLYLENLTNKKDRINICSYKLEWTGYTQNFEIVYNQRKDMGSKKIIDKDASDKYDYDIYTLGGDVSILIEKDMMYKFDNALLNNVITIEDILKQAELDAEYGICKLGYYSDGGSIQYNYENYTIFKYNNLDNNKDFVIGPQNTILSDVTKYIYK